MPQQINHMKTIRPVELICLALLPWCVAAADAGDPLDQWHEIQITGSIPNHVIRYGQGKWLGLKRDEATGASSLVTSTNGRDWTIHTAFEASETVADLHFADGLWLAVGTRESTNVLVLTSTNGADWSSATFPRREDEFPERIRRGAEEWILFGSGSASFFRSADGRTWTASRLGPAPTDTGWIEDIVYSDGRWIALVGGGCEGCYQGLAASTNLTDWQWWQTWEGSPFSQNTVFRGLNFEHGLWFGRAGPYWWTSPGQAGREDNFVTSNDGRNWIIHNAPAGPVTLINGRLFALSRGIWESDPLISLQQNRPGDLIVHRGAGIPVVLESSDDVHQWYTLTNLPLGQPVQPFTDPAGSSMPARFYRVRTP